MSYDWNGSRCTACDSHYCFGNCEPSFDDQLATAAYALPVVAAVMAGDCWACEQLGDTCDVCHAKQCETCKAVLR